MLKELAKDLALLAVERAHTWLGREEEAPPAVLAEVADEVDDPDDDGPLPRVELGETARRMIAEAYVRPAATRPPKDRQRREEPLRGSLRDRARRRA